MSSKVEICNLALIRLGQDTIESLTESSLAARACTLLYPGARQAALRQYPWDFAVTTATLTLLAETPADYDYAYALPSGCLRPLDIITDEEKRIVYEIRGTTLYTDEEDVVLRYTADVTTDALFDPVFVEAFSYRLAADMALTLTGDIKLQEQFLRLFMRAASAAKTANSRQGPTFTTTHSDIVSARA